MNDLSLILPSSANLRELLPDRYTKEIEDLLNKNLIHPVADFFQHPGKNIRPLLVQVGLRLSFDSESQISELDQDKIEKASAIVEMIHSGSLIVDDIQDGSLERRNGPSMHIKHGLPLALNAGNWLYFRALCLVKELNLDPQVTLELLDDLLDLMGKAHLGQALDLGTKINELPLEEIPGTCITSMELKTGTLLSIALRLGMAISGRSTHRGKILELGNKMGLALQMFDDFSNFTNPNSKQYEDLMNQRPSWVWAKVSEMGPKTFEDFNQKVALLPEKRPLAEWSQEHLLENHLTVEIQSYLDQLSQEWELAWGSTHSESLKLLKFYKSILENSYVKKA